MRTTRTNIRARFFKLAKIVPIHSTNRLSDSFIRKDKIFDLLARKTFDNPHLLKLLLREAKEWGRQARDETSCALLGYIYYCAQNFRMAEKYFLKTVALNPRNLDNWFDLAFSLYHQGLQKHELAKKILFNFNICVSHFKKENIRSNQLKNYLVYINKRGNCKTNLEPET